MQLLQYRHIYYIPGSGTVLGEGKQTLTTTLTPTDCVGYNTASASISINVVNKPCKPDDRNCGCGVILKTNPITHSVDLDPPLARLESLEDNWYRKWYH